MAALPLTTLISQSSSRKRNYRALSAQFGDGYQQDAPDGTNNVVDEWNVTYENLSTTDRATLVSFLDTHGSWTSFTWTAPNDGVSKKWKITKDGWSESIKSGNLSSISFSAKQVF